MVVVCILATPLGTIMEKRKKFSCLLHFFALQERNKTGVGPTRFGLFSNLSSKPNRRNGFSLSNFSLPSFSHSYFVSTKHSVSILKSSKH